jgi:hypothetical protein
MERLGLEVAGFADLEDGSGVEHKDPIAHRKRYAQVMGDQNHAHASCLLRAVEKIENLCLRRYVERRGWLVCDQQIGIAGKR